MTNKKNQHPLLQQHFSARAPVPAHPHGHKNGAKVSAFVMIPLDLSQVGGPEGVLMVKRENGSGKVWWEAPGGSMEHRDNYQPKKAVERETLEETGVYVESVFHLPISYKTPRGRTSDFYWCQYKGGAPMNVSSDEHMEVAVIRPDEFSMKVEEGQQRFFVRGDEVQLPIPLIEALRPDFKGAPVLEFKP